MNRATILKKMPGSLQRRLARKAGANRRSVEDEILHRLERSVAADEAEEELAVRLRRSLAAKQSPMKPDDVLDWATETFDQLERPAHKK